MEHIQAGVFGLLRGDDHALVGRLDTLAQPEIGQEQTWDRQRQAGKQDRAVGAQLHPQPGHRKPAMFAHAGAQGVGDVEGNEEASVHDGVEDGVGDGPLGGGGVAPEGRDGDGGAHPFAESQQGHAAAQSHPLDGRERQEHARDDAKGTPEQKRLAQPQRVGQRADQHDSERQSRRPDHDGQAGLLVAEPEVRGKPERQGEVDQPVGQVAEDGQGENDPEFAHGAEQHGELAQETLRQRAGRRAGSFGQSW